MTAPGGTGRRFAAPLHDVLSVEDWPDYAEDGYLIHGQCRRTGLAAKDRKSR